MAKYSVTLKYERSETILIEANSKDEAIELASSGRYYNEQITHTGDERVKILDASIINN